ncbi:PepSY domain-containing protein [Micromonospora sp. NPDC051925]|uniref:PepSY domain-containing protein n=1 Tax=Micromonospora sp. NPDC051925 TaxID=3364288 RepID=UPI0037CC44C4
MKRTSLLLAAVGGAAVLAVTGTALGVSAAERTPAATLAAATTAPAPVDPSTAPTTGTSTGAATPGSPSGAPATEAPGGSTAPATNDAVSQERAGEIALAKVGGGRITEIEREREEGRPVWSVEIINGDTEHEVEVDRENGTVVRSEQEKADADDKSGRDDDDDSDDDRDDSDDGDDD